MIWSSQSMVDMDITTLFRTKGDAIPAGARQELTDESMSRDREQLPQFVPNPENPNCPMGFPLESGGSASTPTRNHATCSSKSVRYLWLARPNLSNLTLYCTCRRSNVPRAWHGNPLSASVTKQRSMTRAEGNGYPHSVADVCAPEERWG